MFPRAGLYSPPVSIPAGWKGLYYAVPSSHVLRAIGQSQFYCDTPPCPQINVPGQGLVDRLAWFRGIMGMAGTPGTRYDTDELAWA